MKFAPSRISRTRRWGFVLWRRVFCIPFLASIFHLPGRQNFEVLRSLVRCFLVCSFLHRFLCTFLRRSFVRGFEVRRFLLRFLCRYSADFPSTFWCFKIGVPESSKNEHKICGNICNVPMALLGWVPYSISALLSRQHVTQ